MYKFSVKLCKKDKLVNTWVTVSVEDSATGLNLSRTIKLFRSLYEERDDSYHSNTVCGFVSRTRTQDIFTVNRFDYVTFVLPTCYGYLGRNGLHYSGARHQILIIRISDFFNLPIDSL